jgi:N-acetylglucosaminyl-diphospho-decaprenol L-rhamnosyltransferase
MALMAPPVIRTSDLELRTSGQGQGSEQNPTSKIRDRRRPISAAAKSPRLSVVIVNYCLWTETAKLVRQVVAAPCTRQGEVEVVVVDNDSPPHEFDRALRRLRGVSLRCWKQNRGFARAVNEGCRLSRGGWVLLLNPDISLSRDFLDGVLRLAERLEAAQPRVGVVGFQLRNADGSRQLSSGPFPALAKTLARLTLPRPIRKYHFLSVRGRQVPWVTGCCMLLRRECLERLGGFDSDYFLYYEDVDLCRRAWNLGWEVVFEHGLSVVHHHPLHSRPIPSYLRFLTRHGLLTYASKHWPCWQLKFLAGLVNLEARWRRGRAKRRADPDGARINARLRQMASAMARGQSEYARELLKEVAGQHGELAALREMRSSSYGGTDESSQTPESKRSGAWDRGPRISPKLFSVFPCSQGNI